MLMPTFIKAVSSECMKSTRPLKSGSVETFSLPRNPYISSLVNGNSSWWCFRRNLPAKERAQRKSQECPRLPVDKLSIPSFTHLVDITYTSSPTYLPLGIEPLTQFQTLVIWAELIFVTNITNYIHGEKMTDMRSGGSMSRGK